MAETVETLKSLFENADCRLNTIMCEVEIRKCKQTNGGTASVDPTELRSKLSTIKEKFAVAKKNYDNVKKMREQYDAELSRKLKKAEDVLAS